MSDSLAAVDQGEGWASTADEAPTPREDNRARQSLELRAQGVEAVQVPPKLAAALVVAHGEMAAAHRDGTNAHTRNAYSSREAIALVAKAAMKTARLAFYVDSHREDSGNLLSRYILVHESGEAIAIRSEMPLSGGGGRSAEQSRGATESYAYKYALLGLFNIPRSDGDPDDQPSKPTRGQSRPQRARQAEKIDKEGAQAEAEAARLDELYAKADKLMKGFDPHYQRSDDPGVVRRGRSRGQSISNLLKNLPPARADELRRKHHVNL